MRVLQVSGYGAGELAPRRISDGTPVFIQKPFTAQALLEAVHAALDCPPAGTWPMVDLGHGQGSGDR